MGPKASTNTEADTGTPDHPAGVEAVLGQVGQVQDHGPGAPLLLGTTDNKRALVLLLQGGPEQPSEPGDHGHLHGGGDPQKSQGPRRQDRQLALKPMQILQDWTQGGRGPAPVLGLAEGGG